MRILVSSVLFCVLPQLAAAASFDCKRASTTVELEICGDRALSVLDEALASNYRAITGSDIGEGARALIKREQRKWLGARNQCGSRECLLKAYVERVDSVCEVPVLSGVHPECLEAGEILARLQR